MTVLTELEHLAARFAARTELWAPHREAARGGRHYVSLRRDDRLDVWAIFWLPGSDTGWHDHDVSSGVVHVLEGELEEHALRVRGDDGRRVVRAGEAWAFGPDHIHRVTCATARAASIHVYSPPLWRMGQYSVTPSGLLRRRSVSYAEELRPVEALSGAAA